MHTYMHKFTYRFIYIYRYMHVHTNLHARTAGLTSFGLPRGSRQSAPPQGFRSHATCHARQIFAPQGIKHGYWGSSSHMHIYTYIYGTHICVYIYIYIHGYLDRLAWSLRPTAKKGNQSNWMDGLGLPGSSVANRSSKRMLREVTLGIDLLHMRARWRWKEQPLAFVTWQIFQTRGLNAASES